jgi:2-phosphosulfolactate phosphatase
VYHDEGSGRRGFVISVDVILSPGEPVGSPDAVVVVDLLRATTLAAVFFEVGGSVLIPMEGLEEARSLRDELRRRRSTPPRGRGGVDPSGLGADNSAPSVGGAPGGEPEWLLLGERGALPPEGFDFGNSPLELIASAERVRSAAGGIHTTTNGTKAILRAAASGAGVFLGCARNAGAAARAALAAGPKMAVLCAGLQGRVAADDGACAGLLVERVLREARGSGEDVMLSDGAKMALAWYRSFGGDLRRAVAEAGHSKKLFDLGLGPDVEFCCRIDESAAVPLMALREGRPILLPR